jgi:hypothetical protein
LVINQDKKYCTCCSKNVEAWTKYIKKECVKLVINQNYVKMHGQQNIKYKKLFIPSLLQWLQKRALMLAMQYVYYLSRLKL